MSEKYKIYNTIYEEVIYIKKRYGYSYEQLSSKDLKQLNINEKVGCELFISDKLLKHELIKDLETDEVLDVRDDLLINGEIHNINRKVFNADFNCYNLYTDKYETIKLEENLKEVFIQKYTELKELNEKIEEENRNKEKEVVDNTIIGRWNNFKYKIRKLVNN